MLETTKPFNVYQPAESGYGSPEDPVLPLRKASLGIMRMRLSTFTAKTSRMQNDCDSRKTSGDSQYDVSDDEDGEIRPMQMYRRRMSVPEKVFLSADYAILRPTLEVDAGFEIVAAFDRRTDPYRQYMQSLSCYDLAPCHGSVLMMDGRLKVHKALTALSESGHSAAVVVGQRGKNSLLTGSDCLRAIIMAAQGENKVADETLDEYVASNNRKKWITADATQSVWEVARLICANRIHRIPVLDDDGGRQNGDVLFFLTLRTVFLETVIKLSDPKFALGPHVKQRTLGDSRIGTWKHLYTMPPESTCLEAIKSFFEKNISCMPVVDEHGQLVGLISKSDIMAELVMHPLNYLEILDIPISSVMSRPSICQLASPTTTVLEGISLLVSSHRPSLFVIDVSHRPIGVVSYSDFMDYIQNPPADPRHKMSAIA